MGWQMRDDKHLKYTPRGTLRTYQRMAHREHACDRCQQPIFPGEMYEAEVTMGTCLVERAGRRFTKKIVSVHKQHMDSCDFPDEPDDCRDDLDQSGEVIQFPGMDRYPLPLAA